MDAETFLQRSAGAVPVLTLRQFCDDARQFLRRPDVHLRAGWVVADFTPEPVRAAVMSQGLLTLSHAALAHGLPQLERPARVHLAVPHSRSHRPPHAGGAVIHRDRQALGHDPCRPWLASVATTVRHLLRWGTRVDAVAALDAALCKGLLEVTDLRLPTHGPGAARMHDWAALAAPGVRSILETMLRLQLVDEGMSVETAVLVDGVGEVDILVDGWLVLEADGDTHSTRAQMLHDRERDLRLWDRGFVVMRVTWEQVRHERVTPIVRAVLGRLGPLPPPERPQFRRWLERPAGVLST
ncbi:DUF559 domain-containing protein [Schaalia sp. 19OD2882]|uniref:endonuclease domain-containing protein n=1 Tax=Schaalia sp. 19OD2882 TaxID=2794089 RepID=UPI001C1ECB59|nr:DUF559 domain-containing protein [Schaalia sp. 19OD2882]QWW20521.1 DUF559 domain-containing protein [Schaalia sp. 19OD2882]